MSAVRETLAEFFERVFENMNIMTRNVETLNRIRLELAELEAKAQELDRREKGALVVNENVLGVDYLMCSNCGALAGNKYCDNCGFKLNFPESEDE